jgi:hypothetical protein
MELVKMFIYFSVFVYIIRHFIKLYFENNSL